MLRAVVYSSIGALLLIVACAKKQQGITCSSTDPATGQCVQEATQVVDPNDTEAVLQRALQSQEQLMAEVERLEGELDAAKQTGDTQKAEKIQQEIDEKNTEASKAPIPMIDENKVPVVRLKLRNKDNMGVRAELSFWPHSRHLSDFVFSYGGQGASHFFNFDTFDKGVQLSEVEVPVQLSFKFKEDIHCARVTVNRRFEETPWPTTKDMRVSKGECKL